MIEFDEFASFIDFQSIWNFIKRGNGLKSKYDAIHRRIKISCVRQHCYTVMASKTIRIIVDKNTELFFLSSKLLCFFLAISYPTLTQGIVLCFWIKKSQVLKNQPNYPATRFFSVFTVFFVNLEQVVDLQLN